MKYYNLTNNGLNIEETGTQFQSTTGIIGDIQQDFIPYEGRIEFDFKLPEPFLEKKAKATSYLNVGMIPSWFLVLKNNFIDFLKDFNIGEYQSWNIKIHDNKKIINDYQLFILNNCMQTKFINFNQSDFFIGKFSDQQYIGECVRISDFNQYKDISDELNKKNVDLYLKHKYITLDFTNIDEDFFRIINVPYSGYYVSENLKTEIIKKGFTGMKFEEIEQIDNRIKVIY